MSLIKLNSICLQLMKISMKLGVWNSKSANKYVEPVKKEKTVEKEVKFSGKSAQKKINYAPGGSPEEVLQARLYLICCK
jgi:hypothetical protein